MTVFSSGISMYAMALLAEAAARLEFHDACIAVRGHRPGLHPPRRATSAIYNEVLQFFLIVFGLRAAGLLGLKDVGGWHGLQARLRRWRPRGFCAGRLDESWTIWASAPPIRWASNGLASRWAGLRAVLRLLVHGLPGRAAGAGGGLHGPPRGARRFIAAVPKMLFPFLVILPGMIAVALPRCTRRERALAAAHGRRHARLQHGDSPHAGPLLPGGMLGLGLTALMAPS